MERRSTSTVLERPVQRLRTEINLSSFALLFSEIVRYSHNRVNSIHELEEKLSEVGERVGIRVLELLMLKDRNCKRETKVSGALFFVQATVWKAIFGKQADLLERNDEEPHSYMISDKEMIVNKYVSVTRELEELNCAAFVAGIVKAVLDGCGMPAKVTAHTVEEKGTTLLIKFDAGKIPADAF